MLLETGEEQSGREKRRRRRGWFVACRACSVGRAVFSPALCCEICLLFVDVPVSFSFRRSVVSPDFSPRTALWNISL